MKWTATLVSVLVFTLLNSNLGAQSPQCPDGRCTPGERPRAIWKQRDDAPGETYLFVDGVQVGGYHRERDEWRNFDGRNWSPSSRLFAAVGETSFRGIEEQTPGGPRRNFGLDLEKLTGRGERYSLCGREVSATQALQALSAGVAFPDDADLLRVTLIGSPEQCVPVLDDLARHSALQDFKDRILVSALRPDNPRIRDAGFKADGQPTIYVQTPGGDVLHRQDEYRGPDLLAEAIQGAERRRKDPNYDPARDPDLNRRPSDNSISIKKWHLYVAAGILLAVLFRRRAS